MQKRRIRMAVRDGIPSLNKTAKRLCALLSKFGPLLHAKYAGNATLIAALTTAQAACALLAQESEKVRKYGD